MIIPPSLKSGDRIGIISTARKILKSEIQPAIDVMEAWGFRVEIGNSIGAEHFQFGGTDELRKQDLQNMLDDQGIKAVLFAKGGYGTVRIIDDIDWRKFLKYPKWLCGFSDITVIHSHLLAVYEIPSIHSLMGVNFKTASPESIESLHEALSGKKLSYQIASHELNRNGTSNGILCGGNLSILNSLNGTASETDMRDKILFIEDIDEHLYHIDRMMLNLKRSGKLDHLAGLIAGHFTEMKNKDENNPFGKSAYEIIAEHVAEFDYPVVFGFPSGHEPDNRALVMGVNWKVEAGEYSEIKMVEVSP